MKIKVQSIHFNADQKLVDYVQKKMDKLETFYDRTVDGEVFLRLNNEGVENKTVEIKLNVPAHSSLPKSKRKLLKVPLSKPPKH